MNTYMVEESENRRLLGALFLSILIHVALLVLVKTTGWGFGFSDVGLNRGGPISVQMGFERSTSTSMSAGQSNVPAAPTETPREGDRSERREVSVSSGLQKPTALARPIPQPRTEVSPASSLQPVAETKPKPASERPTVSVPEPKPEPQVKPVDTPKPQVEPVSTPEPEPEPEPVTTPTPETAVTVDPVEPVMEVQRQPLDEPPAAPAVLTSSSGITSVPVVDAPVTEPTSEPDPVEEQQTVTEEPKPQAIEEPVEEPVEVPDTSPSDDSGDSPAITSPVATDSLEVQSQPDTGTEGGTDGQASEQAGVPDGEPTGSPQPPPPPPSGGDMLGIGGRLVYPKAAETARGGPIEYSVTYEILVSMSGQVIDLTPVDQWFDRDLDERTKQDLLRTAELMMRGLLTFGAYTSDYRMTVELSFDAETGPALKPESRIRPVSDRD